MNKIKPITPVEAANKQEIPDFVFEAFNKLISENYYNKQAKVVQKDAENLIRQLMPDGIDFNYNWLNVESAYQQNGWEVEYDKPAYCESYDAYFVFKEK